MRTGILLYIDPGTGSMLFAVLLGIATTLVFALRGVLIKVKTRVSGGKINIDRNNKIPLVIFSDGKQYWKVFEPICDELERRRFYCEYWTASEDDPALTKKYEYIRTSFIGAGNKPYTVLNMMNAVICLATTPGLDVYQWKRSKDVDCYIHIFHAVDDGLGYRMFGMDYYDVILAASKPMYENIRKLEEMRNLPPKEIYDGGVTYMDNLKLRYDREMSEKDEETQKEIRTVLLAPSWGETSILNRYGEKIIRALLDTGYEIIVRPHPQSRKSDPELLSHLEETFKDNTDLKWNYDNDNYEVLKNSDIMISDFSGVLFDFAFVFDRPIMYADVDYDSSPYDAAWMDHRYMIDCLPQMGRQLKQEEFPQLKSIIDDLIDSKDYSESRNKVREQLWLCEGKSAETITRFLIGRHEEIVKASLDENTTQEKDIIE